MPDPFELTDLAAAPPAQPDYLGALNPMQRQAVEATEGPLLVLAGAGTGKTRVLTARLAHIVTAGHAQPWQVLAVTFTNKAAREMRDRVAALLARPVEGWWVGTFHALAARILRAHAERVGLSADFTIVDTDDQLRLLKQLLEAANIDPKRTPPRLILTAIQRWKDRGLTPERVSEADGAAAVDGRALALYGAYQQRLSALNAADFGDLLLHCLTLFQTGAEVLARYQHQFRYLLVDEYQDTNIAQYLWLRALARVHHNICCVGDDDQSIYSWRGAEIGNILRFEADFPGARVIRLERNYRSTPHILAAASGLIAHNRGRLGKTLRTEHGEGEKIRVLGAWDGEDEARVLCEEVETLHRAGHPLAEMALLVRAGFQTREFEERLITLGIPYRVIGGLRFYERQEIRDAIAYLRVVARPGDDLAFERIVNLPKRGLGTASQQSMHLLARAAGLSLTAAARLLIESDELKPAARRSLARLLEDFARWHGLLAHTPHPEVARIVLDESGYAQMWRKDPRPEAAGRLDNLKELVRALGEFDTLGGFLEHVSLVMDNDQAVSEDKIALMTLHGAKGLEFDTVFLPGWEEGLFPNQRALDEGGTAALEEERRLAYVGLTRARRRAYVLHAASRQLYGRWQSAAPSRFIAELPAANIEQTTPSGVAGRAGRGERWSEQWPGRNGGFGDERRRPLAIDGVPYHGEHRPPPESPFAAGQRVFHQKFGYGRVLAVDGEILEINFEKAGPKRVIHSFVKAA